MTTPLFSHIALTEEEYYEYEVEAIDLIFNPKDYGLNPIIFGPGCRNGWWVCFLEIKNKQLYLRHLIICSDNYPDINGIQAELALANPTYSYIGEVCYIRDQAMGYFNLSLKLEFTGRVKVGDFSSLFGYHRNSNETYKYFYFKNGILEKIRKCRTKSK